MMNYLIEQLRLESESPVKDAKVEPVVLRGDTFAQLDEIQSDDYGEQEDAPYESSIFHQDVFSKSEK